MSFKEAAFIKISAHLNYFFALERKGIFLDF